MKMRHYASFGSRLALGLCLLAWVGCGSTSDENGTLSFNALWEQPDGTQSGGGAGVGPEGGGFGTVLPDSVKTVRLLLESESGLRCCVAIDPNAAPIDSGTGQRTILMSPLPVGEATLKVAGFPADFAPTENEISQTCPVTPTEAASACSLTQIIAPSFQSDTKAVTIVAGVDSDAGDIRVFSVPFLVANSLQPAPRTNPASPLRVSFTVAESITGVDADSVEAELIESNNNVRSLDVTLQSCDDFGQVLCSAGGGLGVTGFRIDGPSTSVASGVTRVRVVADNLAVPPRSLAFAWQFDVQ